MHSLDLAMFENKSVEFGCLTWAVSIVHLGANFFRFRELAKRAQKLSHFLKHEIGTVACSIGKEGS